MVTNWTEMMLSRLYPCVGLSKLYTLNMCSLLNINKENEKEAASGPIREAVCGALSTEEKAAVPLLLLTLTPLPSTYCVEPRFPIRKMGIRIPAPPSTTRSLGELNKRNPPEALPALQSVLRIRDGWGSLTSLSSPCSTHIASVRPHPYLCSAGSRCCTLTATWTARSSGRCLMGPCITSCGSSSAARMPSLRCMIRSARPPGTEQEPAHKETDVWVDPVPRAGGIFPSLKLGCSPRSILSERNPSRNPTQTAPMACSQLPGATCGVGRTWNLESDEPESTSQFAQPARPSAPQGRRDRALRGHRSLRGATREAL